MRRLFICAAWALTAAWATGCATTAAPDSGATAAGGAETSAADPAIYARLTAIEDEIAAIRSDLRNIATGLREVTAPREKALRAENDALQQEVTALRERLEAPGQPPGYFMPSPERPLPNAAAAAGEGGPPDTPLAAPEAPGAPPGALQNPAGVEVLTGQQGIEIISEWGRAPGKGAGAEGRSSLKGAVAFVPPGMGREELIEAGRELRERFGEYDNIHIQGFDSRLAARAYVDNGVAQGGRRVLVVSRHPKTDTDDITVFVDGQPESIPWSEFQAPAPAPGD